MYRRLTLSHKKILFIFNLAVFYCYKNYLLLGLVESSMQLLMKVIVLLNQLFFFLLPVFLIMTAQLRECAIYFLLYKFGFIVVVFFQFALSFFIIFLVLEHFNFFLLRDINIKPMPVVFLCFFLPVIMFCLFACLFD
ncbi:hypothetical protein EGW08_018015 [Elysia chlorotica]|uniref:Uncharacterized protein n=1 Tax=Elysia chlorotica TaxID=188477 RepID=A0A3S0ZSK1_ELYCH|nr:hypothetical protein EGW08_018015 [Elysia chlorotica]